MFKPAMICAKHYNRKPIHYAKTSETFWRGVRLCDPIKASTTKKKNRTQHAVKGLVSRVRQLNISVDFPVQKLRKDAARQRRSSGQKTEMC